MIMSDRSTVTTLTVEFGENSIYGIAGMVAKIAKAQALSASPSEQGLARTPGCQLKMPSLCGSMRAKRGGRL
jgi:hypothetical protein